MKGLELIKKAFALEEVERIPWVPFVGVHGGYLTGVDAETYLKSTDEVVKGVSKAIEEYNPDGVPVVFDLQIEAEILGCNLQWAPHNPPAVITHPLANGTSLADLKVPEISDGRIPVAVEATKILREKHPDVALYGLITGPFTLALHLMGTDIFMKLFEAPEEVNAVMEFCTKVGVKMSEYLLDAGCDIIAVVDPMTSQIDPMTFETFVTPYCTEIFDFVRKKEKLSSFFVCGHAQQNIEAMCNCKPDNVSIDENIPLDFVKEIALKKGISFGGNMKLTVVLLMGNEDDSRENAMECLDMGGKKGFILAPGCDLPMDTPPANIKAVSDLVHDPYKQDVVRALEKKESTLEIFNMKDYGQADKVIVDIITLDSESCAPCQYMVEAVKKVAPQFEGVVEWREHAIKKMDAVTFMSSLMVKNIPTICIDGKIAFVSQIPPKSELVAAIQKRINAKLKLKIQQRKSKILLLCSEEAECTGIKQNIHRAITELGKDIEVKVISDKEKMAKYGVAKGPAVVTVNYKLKSEGIEPSLDVMKEWIKEL
ncbi:thioredoxin family protein [Prolixibacteraceae bacterium Z1-6]|uniref:Thioredoxin family protein n=1 Tax=Draconibacterium aestuarii TaxID=2998507 RepID=A0A9X3FEV3_9BACT|nr:thioredoxin family protein [Prolixibacteraceae bacterium Z1-6]